MGFVEITLGVEQRCPLSCGRTADCDYLKQLQQIARRTGFCSGLIQECATIVNLQAERGAK